MKHIELLAPVGDFECLKAAVQNGADSVYFGGSFFNARNSATNFDSDELEKAINYCTIRNVNTHLTLNTLVKDNEFKDALSLAKQAYELGIDAIIVQDLGLAKYLINAFPNLPIHASTQMTIHNLDGVKELEKLGFKRAVLSRELTLEEIEYICKNTNMEIETFVHGALCISYSGQCLFSSMIGGRSGNRGKCAQPCRLPYTLIEKPKTSHTKLFSKPHRANKEKVLDSGYILSPRDLCALEYLPDLIEAGVTCFKIEGRLKNPEYVATVTRIYRKYIDMALSHEDYVISDIDKKDLMQAFNRGGFSTGHLDSSANQKLICKEKPNNMGLYAGNVANYNKNKGYITLILNEKLSIGDTITFKKEPSKYIISELMIGNTNVTSADVGTKVTIGRMKGKIYIGDKIYKLASKTLADTAHNSYVNCENIKVPLVCELTLKENKPVTMVVTPLHTNMPLYAGIKINIKSNIIPEKAVNNPITKERIISQLCKTTNTPFEFKQIDIQMDNNLHIPSIAGLNELRRMALSQIENAIINNKQHNSNLNLSKLEKYSSKESSGKNKNSNSSKEIAVLLNTLHDNFDYTELNKENINRIYIPLRYFIDKKYSDILHSITSYIPVYIYMPSIIKDNYKNVILHHLDEILSIYPIKGFVISNIADIRFLDKYSTIYDFIGNYILNSYNTETMAIYKKLGISNITLSPELTLENIEDISKQALSIEQIVYGNTPIMTTQYCMLGSSNRCYPNCEMKCLNGNKYYLRDRLGLEFRLLPDNMQTITTIYNSKTTCVTHIETPATSLRIDILDETIKDINNIVNSAISHKKIEGKDYTYGNLNREV